MRLTEKCKEEFQKWYLSTFWKTEKAGQGVAIIDKGVVGLNRFYYLPESMQIGVYEDYFDSVGVLVPSISNGWECFYTTDRGNMQQFKTRKEARTAAIEKANEIRNEQL
jgi:hypothetical protein